MRLAVAVVLFASAARADEPSRLSVVTAKSQPAIESVSVYRAVAQAREARAKAIVTATKLDQPITLPDRGPFTFFVTPKGGKQVVVGQVVTVEPGKTHTIKLVEKLGVVDVFRRDDSPRVGRIVVTDPFDAGPDEKGHVAVQSANDFRVEMLVPEGDYAVWVVPENGARAVRVADRIRVLAGRIVRVD
ncbi:hypothetical protein [Urbifossiella limnaea]|uniref:Uncharacterized protein n=1 Tax=Urbifossiella limnaea TaxID=2528023 RepID=A0A517XMV0_9BACT|nr:hypothetical protein [Urbifossiella limnaea]QDU18838.1 hypothetical protein ETAA1_07340 [Urbifossiella limnaea]